MNDIYVSQAHARPTVNGDAGPECPVPTDDLLDQAVASQRDAISPPGPAPITATLPVIGELSDGSDLTAISLVGLATSRQAQTYGWPRAPAARNRHRNREHKKGF